MNHTIPIFFLALTLLPGFSARAADEATYEGTKVCSKCHDQQGEAWEATSHAKAFDLLKPGIRADAKTKAKLDPNKDYTTDASCLNCHSTGYGRAGGYVPTMPPALLKSLAGVGCESCHGPGSLFKKEHGDAEGRFKKGGTTTERNILIGAGQNFDYKKACLECHGGGTGAHRSPFDASIDPKYAFDFDKAVRAKGKGIHDHFKLIGVFSGEPVPPLRTEFQQNAKE